MIQFKEPDRNAPRYRPKSLNVLDNNLVKRFKERYPQYPDITLEQIRRIIKAFHEEVWQIVVDTRDGVDLPAQMGTLFIGSCKPDTSANYNYKESIKHGKPVRYSNVATDGYVGKIFYHNSQYSHKFPFRELWAFSPTRGFKAIAAKTYPENFSQYLMVDNIKLLTLKAEQQKRMEDIQAYYKKKDNFEEYNEFDLT